VRTRKNGAEKMVKLNKMFTEEDLELIRGAVEGVQQRSSGKVRVRVEKKAGRHPLKKAKEAFVLMGMKDMPDRNGVLFYVSVADRKFAVLGDDGINEKVPVSFWENVKDAVIAKLSEGDFAIGLMGGINLVSEKLAEFFPDEKEEPENVVSPVSYAE